MPATPLRLAAPAALGVAADGPRGDGHVAAEGDGARHCEEGADGGGVVEDEDEVGDLDADLAAEAAAGGGDGRGRGPGAVGEAGDDEARAEARRAQEAGLDDGDDGGGEDPFARLRISGGMIFSGPNWLLGSTTGGSGSWRSLLALA